MRLSASRIHRQQMLPETERRQLTLPEREKHPLNKLIRVNFSPASAFPFLSALFSLNLGFLILKMNFSFCVYFSFARPTSSDEEATVDAMEEIAWNAAEEAAKITAEEAAKIAAEEAAKTAANATKATADATSSASAPGSASAGADVEMGAAGDAVPAAVDHPIVPDPSPMSESLRYSSPQRGTYIRRSSRGRGACARECGRRVYHPSIHHHRGRARCR